MQQALEQRGRERAALLGDQLLMSHLDHVEGLQRLNTHFVSAICVVAATGISVTDRMSEI